MTADRCVYCSEPVTPDQGRWCDDCADVARLDPLCPVSLDLVVYRRMRRTATKLIEHIDVAERITRAARTRAS